MAEGRIRIVGASVMVIRGFRKQFFVEFLAGFKDFDQAGNGCFGQLLVDSFKLERDVEVGAADKANVCNPQAAHDFGLAKLEVLNVAEFEPGYFFTTMATADHKEIRGDEVDLTAVVQEIPGGIDDEW